MFQMNAHVLPRMAVTLTLVVGVLVLQGCHQEIDARQAHVEQGLIYKKDSSDPFTGTLTNVDIVQVAKRYAAQYGAWEGSCTVPVKDGQFDGVATCKNGKGKKIGEYTYSNGQIEGAVKMWAPDTDNLMMSMTVHGGVTDGVQERFNPKSGKIISRVAYTEGKKSGEEKQWDITGDTLLTDLTWENGKQTGVYRYGESEEHYVAGERDGTWRTCRWREGQPAEKNNAFRAKYDAYYAMAEKLGGSYFIPAMVDSQADVVCTEEVYTHGVKQVQPAPAVNTALASSGNACLDAKIAAFHKENGEEAPIINDVIQEWEAGCKQ